jgi:hypothetical protein
MKDQSKVSTGGLVAAPISISDQIATSRTQVRVGAFSNIETWDRDLLIFSKTEESIRSQALTDVYGLVSGGASARALAQQTSSDAIIFGKNSNIRVWGNVDVISGGSSTLIADQAIHDIVSSAIIFNATPIPISSGKRSDANLIYSSNIILEKGVGVSDTADNSGALITSFGDINISAGKGVNAVSSVGENNYSVLLVPVNETFGEKSIIASSGISNQGVIDAGLGRDAWLYLDGDLLASGATQSSISASRIKPSSTASDSRSERLKFTVISETPSNALSEQLVVLELQRDQHVTSGGTKYTATTASTRATFIAGAQSYYLYKNTSTGNFYRNISSSNAASSGWEQIAIDVNGNVTYSPISGGVTVAPLYLASAWNESNVATRLNATGQPLQEQINFISAKIASMNTSGTVQIINIDPIEVRAGNINLVADYVVGSGRINAYSNPSISIISASPNPIRIKAGTDINYSGLTITDLPGGAVYFNSAFIPDASALAAKNRFINAPVNRLNTSPSINSSSVYEPTIKVSMSYGGTKDPELYLDGRIQNLGGTVNIENSNGSIYSKGVINAGSVKIAAGGDFFVSAVTNLYNIGSNPASTAVGADFVSSITGAMNRAYARQVSDPVRGESLSYEAGSGISSSQAPRLSNLSDDQFQSATIAGGNIYITAQTVNINGLIQSGMPSRTLIVTDQSISSAWVGVGSWSIDSSSPTFSLIPNTTEYTKKIEATFNRNASGVEWIEVAPIKLKGGSVYISGKIASTGNGKVNAQDGFGTVTIDNQTSKTLVINSIDNSEVEGKITFVDYFKLGMSPETAYIPLVTEYTRKGAVNEVRTYYSNQPRPVDPNAFNANNPNAAYQYSPDANLFYKFMLGETYSVSGNIRSSVSTIFGGLVETASNISQSALVNSSPVLLSAADMPRAATLSRGGIAPRDSQGRSTGGPQTADISALILTREIGMYTQTGSTTTSSWFGLSSTTVLDIYWRKDYERFYTFSINASKPIEINFIGRNGVNAAGLTQISSKGGVVLNGPITSVSYGSNDSVSLVSVSAGVGNTSGGTYSITSGAGTGAGKIAASNVALRAPLGSIGVVSGTSTESLTIKPIEITYKQLLDKTYTFRGEPLGLNFIARDNVAIHASGSAAYISATGNSSGNAANGYLSLQVQGNFNFDPLATPGVVKAAGIRLISDFGTFRLGLPSASIATTQVSTDPNNALGTLTMSVGSGDINVLQNATPDSPKDLLIYSLSAPGDITVTTNYGSIRDGNSVQRTDVLATEALEKIWDSMQLLADPTALTTRYSGSVTYAGGVAPSNNGSVVANGNINSSAANTTNVSVGGVAISTAANKIATQKANYNSSMNQLYQDYWSMRAVNVQAGTVQAYDPNYRYVASTAERTTLSGDATAIANYENTQTARYQQAHEFFVIQRSQTTYSSGYRYAVESDTTAVTRTVLKGEMPEGSVLKTVSGPGTVAATDAVEINTATNLLIGEGGSWNINALRSRIPALGLREVTDTKAFIENNNISGRNITLTANQGAIGRSLTAVYVDVTDLANPVYVTSTGASLSTPPLAETPKLLLSRVESDDVTLINLPNGHKLIKVIDRDTLDLSASGKVSATSSGTGSNGEVLLGSEDLINLTLAKSINGEQVRIKAYGSIVADSTNTGAHVYGGSIILESASGSIGTADTPIRIDQVTNASFTARAAQNITIETLEADSALGRSRDIRVNTIYSPQAVSLNSRQGAILDNSWTGIDSVENGWGTDIKAKNITLRAATSIGLYPELGDTVATMRGKALDIANVDTYDTNGNALHSVALYGATSGINLMTPISGTIRYTDVLITGSARLDTARELITDGNVRSGGDFAIYGANEYGVLVNIQNTGLLRAGNTLSVAAIDEGQIIGKSITYESLSGGISLSAGREVQLRSAAITAPGNIELLASNGRGVSALVDAQATMTAGNALTLRAQNEGYVIAAGTFTSANDANFFAGRSIDLGGSVTATTGTTNVVAYNSNSAINTAVVVDANITAGSDVVISASGPQATVSVNGGAVRTISAGDDLSISSVNDLSVGGNLTTNTGSNAIGITSIYAGNNLNLTNVVMAGGTTLDVVAGNDLAISGSLRAAGDISLQANRRIDIAVHSTILSNPGISTAGSVSIRSNNGNISLYAPITSSAGNIFVQTEAGNINYGLNIRSSTLLASGLVSLITGNGNITINTKNESDITINAGVLSLISRIGNISTVGRIRFNLGLEILADLGNIQIGGPKSSMIYSSSSGNALIRAGGIYNPLLSDVNQVGNITIAPRSSLAMGSGKLEMNAGSLLTFSSISSASNAYDAIKLSGFDVIHNSDTNADIRMTGNGGVLLRAYRYIDINNIDYRGTLPLYLEMTGVANNGNSAASAVAVGIRTSAPVEIMKLYAGYAAISAATVPSFNVVDARIARTSFFDVNGTIGRVGDIDVAGIDYASWTQSQPSASAFTLGNAIASGSRTWDFNVSGTQASEGLAVLGFDLGLDFSGSKPLLNTNAIVVNYRPIAYRYAGLSLEEIAIQEELAAAARAQAALAAAAEQARIEAAARAAAVAAAAAEADRIAAQQAAARIAAQLEADRIALLAAAARIAAAVAEAPAPGPVPAPIPPALAPVLVIQPVTTAATSAVVAVSTARAPAALLTVIAPVMAIQPAVGALTGATTMSTSMVQAMSSTSVRPAGMIGVPSLSSGLSNTSSSTTAAGTSSAASTATVDTGASTSSSTSGGSASSSSASSSSSSSSSSGGASDAGSTDAPASSSSSSGSAASSSESTASGSSSETQTENQ